MVSDWLLKIIYGSFLAPSALCLPAAVSYGSPNVFYWLLMVAYGFYVSLFVPDGLLVDFLRLLTVSCWRPMV